MNNPAPDHRAQSDAVVAQAIELEDALREAGLPVGGLTALDLLKLPDRSQATVAEYCAGQPELADASAQFIHMLSQLVPPQIDTVAGSDPRLLLRSAARGIEHTLAGAQQGLAATIEKSVLSFQSAGQQGIQLAVLTKQAPWTLGFECGQGAGFACRYASQLGLHDKAEITRQVVHVDVEKGSALRSKHLRADHSICCIEVENDQYLLDLSGYGKLLGIEGLVRREEVVPGVVWNERSEAPPPDSLVTRWSLQGDRCVIQPDQDAGKPIYGFAMGEARPAQRPVGMRSGDTSSLVPLAHISDEDGQQFIFAADIQLNSGGVITLEFELSGPWHLERPGGGLKLYSDAMLGCGLNIPLAKMPALQEAATDVEPEKFALWLLERGRKELRLSTASSSNPARSSELWQHLAANGDGLHHLITNLFVPHGQNQQKTAQLFADRLSALE